MKTLQSIVTFAATILLPLSVGAQQNTPDATPQPAKEASNTGVLVQDFEAAQKTLRENSASLKASTTVTETTAGFAYQAADSLDHGDLNTPLVIRQQWRNSPGGGETALQQSIVKDKAELQDAIASFIKLHQILANSDGATTGSDNGKLAELVKALSNNPNGSAGKQSDSVAAGIVQEINVEVQADDEFVKKYPAAALKLASGQGQNVSPALARAALKEAAEQAKSAYANLHANSRTLAFFSSLEDQVVHLQQVKDANSQAQAAKDRNAPVQTVGFFGPHPMPPAATADTTATGN